MVFRLKDLTTNTEKPRELCTRTLLQISAVKHVYGLRETNTLLKLNTHTLMSGSWFSAKMGKLLGKVIVVIQLP